MLLPLQFGGSLSLVDIELPASRFSNDGYSWLVVRNLASADRKARVTAQHACFGGVPPHADTLLVNSGGNLHLLGPFERIFNGAGSVLSVAWLDSTDAPLADPTGVSAGAISLKTRAQLSPGFTAATGITSLQTAAPPLFPVVESGGAIVPYVPDRLGNRYRFEGGEAFLVRNDRGAPVHFRHLAVRACTDDFTHHLTVPCATGRWTVIGPLNASAYRTAQGHGEFLVLDDASALLPTNTGLGIALVRMRRNLAP